VRGGVFGATLVGFAFVLPSFLMVLALSAVYLRFEGLPWMQGLFYGIGAAVIAIIARSAVKLVRMTLAKDWLLWALFGASAVATARTESEIVWVFVGSGVLAMLIKAPPRMRAGPAAMAPLVPQ
jgi:chromate transporter